MGQQQSSGRADASQDTAPAKTCYYELLAVDRQATDEEPEGEKRVLTQPRIKKAYRRKALELHPDRNLDNVSIATQKFAEVQTAYEVLSDPQERAWYDAHRDAILRGSDEFGEDTHPQTFHNVRLTSTEEIHSLISKFNATIPFNDEPTGFFGVARETFEHLALEEEAASDFNGGDCPSYPSFGSSGDDYETIVKPFYNVWGSFGTRKSFSWKDKYRLSEAPDRRVRRLMEKENKKIRDSAIQEFNDAIRFLVAFVRKRDPRYLPNTQTDTERQKSMRDAAAAQAAKARAANQEKIASYQPPSWTQYREESAEEDNFPETEESDIEVLECIVCNKTFKSEKQLQVHEESKKHIKAAQKLRWRMKKEGAELDLEAGQEMKPADPTGDSTIPHGTVATTSDKTHDFQEGDRHNHTRDDNPSDIVGETSAISDDTLDDDDYAPRSTVEDRLNTDESEPSKERADEVNIEHDLLSATEKVSVQDTAPKKKVGKAKAKREKKAAQSAPKTETHRCTICQEEFSSRTKLFSHIRDEGHAAPLAAKAPQRKREKKKQ